MEASQELVFMGDNMSLKEKELYWDPENLSHLTF